MENRILVIDDEEDFLQTIRRVLTASGFGNVQLDQSARSAAERIELGEDFDVALIDFTLPEMNGVQLLEHIKTHSPDTECIMVTAVNEARTAVNCLRKGAYDYLVKPVSREDLLMSLERALERKRFLDLRHIEKARVSPELSRPEAFAPIKTGSDRILRVLKEAELHAASNVPVLITGESGTGKELLARAIHAASPRSNRAFTPVNMASLSASLFDAEFFGHTRGAFTGAEKDRTGYLENTHRGTLFLDEIGNLPLELQGKLLRVLQEGEYMKLGTSAPRKVDVRFVTATNADLDHLVARKEFRKDLYYRLKGAWLNLPPLRERTRDIPVLVDAFLREIKARKKPSGVDENAMTALVAYDYPGNIRELKSIVQSAVNLSEGETITRAALPVPLRTLKAKGLPPEGPSPVIPLARVEKQHILKSYEKTGRNKTQTAKLLGIGLNTLRRKLRSYGVE